MLWQKIYNDVNAAILNSIKIVEYETRYVFSLQFKDPMFAFFDKVYEIHRRKHFQGVQTKWFTDSITDLRQSTWHFVVSNALRCDNEWNNLYDNLITFNFRCFFYDFSTVLFVSNQSQREFLEYISSKLTGKYKIYIKFFVCYECISNRFT